MKHLPLQSIYKANFEVVEEREGRSTRCPHGDQLPVLLRALNLEFYGGLPARLARADHRADGFTKVSLQTAAPRFSSALNAALRPPPAAQLTHHSSNNFGMYRPQTTLPSATRNAPRRKCPLLGPSVSSGATVKPLSVVAKVRAGTAPPSSASGSLAPRGTSGERGAPNLASDSRFGNTSSPQPSPPFPTEARETDALLRAAVPARSFATTDSSTTDAHGCTRIGTPNYQWLRSPTG